MLFSSGKSKLTQNVVIEIEDRTRDKNKVNIYEIDIRIKHLFGENKQQIKIQPKIINIYWYREYVLKINTGGGDQQVGRTPLPPQNRFSNRYRNRNQIETKSKQISKTRTQTKFTR